jgi:hypothetical protein
MHRSNKSYWLLGVVVAWGASATTAQAQFGGGSNGFYLFNMPYNAYGYSSESIPYYALHPPVYYSLPVPRTYGYSPFAYPPGFMTPELVRPDPKVTVNPYVPRRSAPRMGERVTTAPRVIVNPYVARKPHSSDQIAVRDDAVEPEDSPFETPCGP